MVEVTGLEPAASCSQSRHSSQTELHLEMIIKFLRSCSFVLCSPSCKIVALHTAVFIALFCCASSSSLNLPPAAVAFVTQSRHSSQTELHLEVYINERCSLFVICKTPAGVLRLNYLTL